jgi:YfiR/HmsC-like
MTGNMFSRSGTIGARFWRASRAVSRRALPGVLIGILSGTLAPALGQSGSGSEYAVKAAFLFHFAQFVEWPAEAFKDGGSPITYCTMGEDPFHGGLDQALVGKTVGVHPLRVDHLREFEKVSGCQVLFLGAGEKKWIADALAGVSRFPILTVGETEHFVQEGGIIGFCLEENKIRFEINLDAAGKAKLKISAKLLALAKTVVTGPRGS